jgi:ABC-type uncharacterized transport system substrate-binding protein
MILKLFLRLIFCLFAVAWPTIAFAHPHVWVDMRSNLVFAEDGKITGVDLQWTFDDVYAAEALNGLDVNGDGEYSPEELVPLTEQNLKSLQGYNYFTLMKSGAKQLEAAAPIRSGQTYINKKLKLHFEVPLKVPFDPHKGEFMLKVYDPEYFIEFDYTKKQPVGVEGVLPSDCKLVLKPLLTTAETNQTLAMLSTKPIGWQPENGEDFGSIFAQPTLVTCNP